MQPKIYHASHHDIDSTAIDPDAIHIIQMLNRAGFIAYLVGGSVRDLLVKKKPKDFDISTSALPEQIKQIFGKSCVLIGRRFRLAHIRLGHKIFEVSTFRSGENDSDLIVHDNLWGTPEEDVLRRDFTINGLYYDPETHTVIDYVGGWDDIHKHTLRTIGEPITRFKQDPVRMIRLLKFQARFDFHVDKAASQAMKRCLHEITKSSPARILEEMLRMLESGAAAPFFRLMVSADLLEHLFPCLNFFLKGNSAEDVYAYLATADKLCNLDLQPTRKITFDRSILTACLLYPMLEKELHDRYLKHGTIPRFGEILLLTGSIIKGVLISSFSHFPKRLTMMISYILSAQYRLTPITKTKHPHNSKLLNHREFDLALQFLMIRSHLDESLVDEYNWWSHLYRDAQRHAEHRGHRPHQPPDRRRSPKEERAYHNRLISTLDNDSEDLPAFEEESEKEMEEQKEMEKREEMETERYE